MGKETELWDDSALIDAFNQALRNYKTLNSGKSNTDATIVGRGEIADDNHAEPSSIEPIQITSETETETKGEILQRLPSLEDEAPQETSTVQENQPQPESSSRQEYTQLLTQYYELEEKRQRILQQIQQSGYYNCLTYAQTSSAPQAGKESSDTCVPHHNLAYPFNGTWPSPEVTDGPTGQNLGKQSIHLTTGATEPSRGLKYGINREEREIGKDAAADEAAHEEVRVMETDLATVVNSWYAAGFYTGRYLLEQSYKRSQ
ncbi:uncharacterized protein LOC144710116 [Wolffia australiana]